MYQTKHTAKEASEFLGLVCMPYTVHKAVVLVGLHTSLDAVEGKSCQRREDTGCAGCHLCPISFDEPFMLRHGVSPRTVPLFSFRHHVARCCCCSWCALLNLDPAGAGAGAATTAALCRHGRRMELGTILLLEGDQLSWHAFWQIQGPDWQPPLRQWPLLTRDQSR